MVPSRRLAFSTKSAAALPRPIRCRPCSTASSTSCRASSSATRVSSTSSARTSWCCGRRRIPIPISSTGSNCGSGRAHRVGGRAPAAGGGRLSRLRGSAVPGLQRAARGSLRGVSLGTGALPRRLVAVINLQHRHPHEHSRRGDPVDHHHRIPRRRRDRARAAREREQATIRAARNAQGRRSRQRHPAAGPRHQRRRGVPHHPATEPAAAEIQAEIAEAILLADDLHRGRGGS